MRYAYNVGEIYAFLISSEKSHFSPQLWFLELLLLQRETSTAELKVNGAWIQFPRYTQLINNFILNENNVSDMLAANEAWYQIQIFHKRFTQTLKHQCANCDVPFLPVSIFHNIHDTIAEKHNFSASAIIFSFFMIYAFLWAFSDRFVNWPMMNIWFQRKIKLNQKPESK